MPRCCASVPPSSAWTPLPYFYALSENYGEPDKDYLLQYQEGRLTWEAKTVYETILIEGPLDTVSLRKLARMTSKASDSPFNRALETLQADFKILPVGIAEAGAWKYAFIYECVHRHYPDLLEQARAIRQAQARQHLVELYLRSVGAAQVRDLALLFGWPKGEIEAAAAALVQGGTVRGGVTFADRPGELDRTDGSGLKFRTDFTSPSASASLGASSVMIRSTPCRSAPRPAPGDAAGQGSASRR